MVGSPPLPALPRRKSQEELPLAPYSSLNNLEHHYAAVGAPSPAPTTSHSYQQSMADVSLDNRSEMTPPIGNLDTTRIEKSKRGAMDIDFNYEEDEHLPPPPSGQGMAGGGPGEFHGDTHDIKIYVKPQVYLYTACAALNSCNLGYDIGVNTDAAKLIQESMDLSDVQIEVFMGSLNLFAMIGALCAQFISDNLGRRRAFIAASSWFVVGVLVMSFANSYVMLIFGRIFVGMGVGFGLAIDPLYIAEISPAAHRGRLVTWSEIATNIGIVLGFSSGLIFGSLPTNTAWRYMLGMGSIIPTIMIFLVICVMPESPRWLVAKDRDEEAYQILTQIYPDNFHVENVVKDIRESLAKEMEAEHAVGWDVILFPTPAFRRMLLVGFGAAIAQQAVGIDAIQYFLIYIIDESGIESSTGQSLVLIFLGLLKLMFIFVASNLFDRRGRRPLMFISLGGMALALLFQSMNFIGKSNPGFTIFSLALYLIFFSVGMGPGAWLIPSEVFSTSIRAKAMSVATFLNRVVATIMTSTFLTVADQMSWAGFFLLMSFVCFIIAIFFFMYLPETKGRALEDMALYFAEITGDRSILDIEEEIAQRQSRVSSAHDLELVEQEGDSRIIDGSVRVEATGTMA